MYPDRLRGKQRFHDSRNVGRKNGRNHNGICDGSYNRKNGRSYNGIYDESRDRNRNRANTTSHTNRRLGMAGVC